MMARNRVSSLTEQIVPRLELMTVVLGSRLLDHVQKTKGTKQAILWSDSQIVGQHGTELSLRIYIIRGEGVT